jgi:hypothetical protein
MRWNIVVSCIAALVILASSVIGNATATPEKGGCPPVCGGGGGGSPLAISLSAWPGENSVSVENGCVGNPQNMCGGNTTTTYTAPIMDPNNNLYNQAFNILAAGGDFTYNYYRAFPGSNGWISGSEVHDYKFTQVGTYSVGSEITENGFGGVTVTLTVKIVTGTPGPSAQISYSTGGIGWGVSANEFATQWIEEALEYSSTITTVVAVALALTGAGVIAAGVAALLASIFAVYEDWAKGVDQGNGVCFEDNWYDPELPAVVANPCTWGF